MSPWPLIELSACIAGRRFHTVLPSALKTRNAPTQTAAFAAGDLGRHVHVRRIVLVDDRVVEVGVLGDVEVYCDSTVGAFAVQSVESMFAVNVQVPSGQQPPAKSAGGALPCV